MKKKAARHTPPPRRPPAKAPPAERTRTLLLWGIASVYVARPLLASETPALIVGDGLPFVMLTLVLTAAWAGRQFTMPHVRLRCGAVEILWLALLIWMAISTYAAMRHGYARAAINVFWEWVGLGAGYVLLRQLLLDDREKRAFVAVFMTLALTLSLDGISQYFLKLPLTREQFRRDPEAVLAAAHVYAPPGTIARTLFEQRLASTEPYATFALANSLAGFLTPWLLVALAVGWLGEGGDPALGSRPTRRVLAATACVAAMALCLVLTKSRAGYLATLAGLGLLILLSRRSRRQTWLIIAASAATGMALAAIGFFVGALDRQVVSEGVKSLSYRWHYWQGALGIIGEHPWVGCGVGNFKDEYTRFKLPQASEVVADPHNFVFEIWATAGTPALIVLLTMLGGSLWQARRAVVIATSEPSDNERHFSPVLLVLASGVAGCLLAYSIGLVTSVRLPEDVFFTAAILFAASSACFAGWIHHGHLPRYVPFLAVSALLINLLVAGGISFPGVAGSLWLLVAIGLPDEAQAVWSLPRWASLGIVLFTAGLVGACYFSAYRPSLECARLIARAENSEQARADLLAAASADPLADEPRRMLAEGDFELWRRQPHADSSSWEEYQREALRRRPHSSVAWQEAGERYLAAYRKAPMADAQRFLSEAIEHFREATRLYPNSALLRARLAQALAAAADSGARQQATLALALHDQTPHIDQKLPPELLEQIRQISVTVDSGGL